MSEYKNEFQNAGFVPRFFATIVDGLISWLLYLAPLIFFIKAYLRYETIDPVTHGVNLITYIVVAMVLAVIVQTAYSILFVSHFGGTLGKLLFGLKIVDYNTNNLIDYKTSFYRSYCGYTFSGAFFGLGFLRVARHPEKLGWHDELFNTKVIRTNSWLPGMLSFIILFGLLAYVVMSLAGLVMQSQLIKALNEKEVPPLELPVE